MTTHPSLFQEFVMKFHKSKIRVFFLIFLINLLVIQSSNSTPLKVGFQVNCRNKDSGMVMQWPAIIGDKTGTDFAVFRKNFIFAGTRSLSATVKRKKILLILKNKNLLKKNIIIEAKRFLKSSSAHLRASANGYKLLQRTVDITYTDSQVEPFNIYFYVVAKVKNNIPESIGICFGSTINSSTAVQPPVPVNTPVAVNTPISIPPTAISTSIPATSTVAVIPTTIINIPNPTVTAVSTVPVSTPTKVSTVAIANTPTSMPSTTNGMFRGTLLPINSCQLPALPSDNQLRADGMQTTEFTFNKGSLRGPLKANIWWVNKGNPRPVVITGVSGYDNTYRRVLSEGYAIISPVLLGEAPLFPKAIGDLRCVLRWTKANATKYNLDPSRIVVSGFSMSAWANSVLATITDAPELNTLCDTPENYTFKGSIKGVIALSGSYDHVKLGGNSFYNQYGLGNQTNDVRLQTMISASRNITTSTPPFILIHGVDEIEFGDQARIFQQKLNDNKIPVVLMTHPGGHLIDGQGVLAEGGNRTINCTTVDFLRKVLK